MRGSQSSINECQHEILIQKVVLIGEQGVGKTSLVNRYTQDLFSNSLENTIGATFSTKIIDLKVSPQGDIEEEHNTDNTLNLKAKGFERMRIKLQIWDTAGEERFRSVTPMYYKNAHAIVLVYDQTNEKSFNNLESWV